MPHLRARETRGDLETSRTQLCRSESLWQSC